MAAVSGGAVLTYGRMTGTPRGALRHWVSGRCRPRIGNLLRMCYSLCVPLTAFLDETEPPELAQLRCEERVRKALDQALTEDPPPSLTDVARRLDYTRTERLIKLIRAGVGDS
jgi:hypothetical protein